MLTSKFNRVLTLSIAAAVMAGSRAVAAHVVSRNVAANRKAISTMLGNTFAQTRFAAVEKDTISMSATPFAILPKHNLHSTCIKADAGVPSLGIELQASYKNADGFYANINAPLMMSPMNLDVEQTRKSQNVAVDAHPRLVKSLREDGVRFGINDINTRVGYTFVNTSDLAVDMFINGKLPMGRDIDEQAPWRTMIGSRHFGLGLGFGAQYKILDMGDIKARIQSEISYNYDFRRINKNISVNVLEKDGEVTTASVKSLGTVRVSPGHNLNGQLVGVASWKFIDCQIGGTLDFNTTPHFFKESVVAAAANEAVTVASETAAAVVHEATTPAVTVDQKKEFQALSDIRKALNHTRINHSLHAMVRVNAPANASAWLKPVSFSIGGQLQNAKHASLVSSISLTF